MTATVALRPMSGASFDAYAVRAIPLLAEAQARAYGSSAEAARASAEAAFFKIRADAEPEASGQHLYAIEAAGADVGALWFELRQAALDPYVYLYDWVIWPEYRGQGLGSAAMRLLEQRARARGAQDHAQCVQRQPVRCRSLPALRLRARFQHPGQADPERLSHVSVPRPTPSS